VLLSVFYIIYKAIFINIILFIENMVDLSGLYMNLLEALVIIILGIILGNAAYRLTLRFMSELEVTYLFRKATKMRVTLDKLVSSFVQYLVYISFLVFALNTLGILRWAGLLFAVILAITLIVTLTIYLLCLFPNLWARLKLMDSGIEIGKVISVRSITGKIMSTDLQGVKLNSGIYLPYKFLSRNKFRLN